MPSERRAYVEYEGRRRYFKDGVTASDFLNSCGIGARLYRKTFAGEWLLCAWHDDRFKPFGPNWQERTPRRQRQRMNREVLVDTSGGESDGV